MGWLPNSGMRMSHVELVDLAMEALRRANYMSLDDGMHPEDWAAALVPAIEAVAIGFSEGYARGRTDMKQILAEKEGRDACECE